MEKRPPGRNLAGPLMMINQFFFFFLLHLLKSSFQEDDLELKKSFLRPGAKESVMRGVACQIVCRGLRTFFRL